MGDRANIVVKCGKEQVCLYTHWDGTNLPKILQNALKRGKSRWADFQYLTRIIFSEMIKDYIMDECGYGITQTPWDGQNKIITVDAKNGTVTLNGNPMTITEYCKLRNPEWE